jgi:hypothetical protein
VEVKITVRAKLQRDDEASIRQEVDIMRQWNHLNVVGFVYFFEDRANFYTVL